MGQGQTKAVVDAATALAAPVPLQASDFEKFPLFWSVPITRRDTYTELPAKLFVELRKSNPHKFALLLVHVVHRLYQAVKTPDQSKNDEVLMALRMLTRTLPIAFDGSDEDHLAEQLFWENKLPESSEKVEPLLPSEEGKSESVETVAIPAFDGLLSGAPLAQRVLDLLVRLMFLPNFTIVPINVEKSETKDSDVPLKYAWAPGAYTKTVEYYNQTWQFDNHRLEVVLCLLTALSRPVYSAPKPDVPCRWLAYLAGTQRVFSRVMIASLMNVAMRYDPVGWGVPYNHVLSQDVSEQLMNVSLELLSILLEYKSTAQLQPAQYQQTPAHQATEMPTTGQKSPESKNVFIELLEHLKEPDYEFIFNGVLRILNNPVVATNTYLPNSTKSVSCQQEMLTVYWQLIQLSRPFLMYCLKRNEFIELIYPVLHYIYQGRKDSAQLGLVHLGVFFLLYLSGEREFSIALNHPFNKPLIIDIPKFWGGTYADYLVLVIIQMIIDGQKRLDSLWECLLTVLSNVSPYIKTLTAITATRLLKLSVTLSKRSWLLAREKNHRYIFFLLETFNNVLQYQFEGNTHLVYSIISYRDHFFKLLEIAKPVRAAPSQPTSTTEPESAVETSEKLTESTNAAEKAGSPSSASTGPVASSSHVSGPTSHSTATEATSTAPKQGPQSQSASQLVTEHEDTFHWTQQWLEGWSSRLPISTIIRFLNGILPQIEAIVEGAATDQELILNFLKKTTLVGILPVPHPILIRHYSASKQTNVWFLQYIWGVIFIRHYVDLQIFMDTQPRLFNARLPTVGPGHHHHHKH